MGGANQRGRLGEWTSELPDRNLLEGLGSGDLPDRYKRRALACFGLMRTKRAVHSANEGGTTGLPSFFGQGPFLYFGKFFGQKKLFLKNEYR